jgi:NAD(P)H-nitrite reductase large subunit
VSDTNKTDYLIIGGGIAGVAAAEAIRDADSVKDILIINGEKSPPYCRPLIIELLTGERPFDEIVLRPPEWYTEKNISLINGERANSIDPDNRTVTLESGKLIEFERLLIASGSIPAIPPIPGLDDVPSFSLYRREDVENLKSHCKEGTKALVIGIGLIGLQAITAFKQLGADVVAVEMINKVLPLILDKEAAKYAQARLEENGIEVHIGTAIKEVKPISGKQHQYLAITNTGEEIGFDYLVLATGMKPETSFLNGSGVDIGRGIKVSQTMETNIPGIHAAGDVVEYPNWIEGNSEIHAHWVNAYRQGRVSGLSMAGIEAEPYEPVYLNSLSVFGLPIITMGASRLDETDGTEVYITEIPERSAYTRFLVKDKRLIAATFVNDIDRAGVLQYLIREKIDVGDVAHSLFEQGKRGLEFLYKLHNEDIRGDVEWAPSMDLIDKYRKDMKRTRWGGEK